MRFLFLTSDYPDFLHWLYARHPGLEKQDYHGQMREVVGSLFHKVDFYANNLRKLGHEAEVIHYNNEFLQKAWAREHGTRFKDNRWRFIMRGGLLPWVIHVNRSWQEEISMAQVKDYRPDVLFNTNMIVYRCHFFNKIKPYFMLLFGQHAHPATTLPSNSDFSCYDLVISSYPPLVEYFQRTGVHAEFHNMGFEHEILSLIPMEDKKYDVTFIGNFYSIHGSRASFFEDLCVRVPQLKIWGAGIERLSLSSPIRKCYMGEAWGNNYYQILRCSKITINHHGDVPLYANNQRLFEATGVGTLLITDWKQNLKEMFEPGTEVITYRDVDECANLIRYYLEYAEEREKIASAGRLRTLKEHTYYHRMKEILDILEKYF